MIKVSSVSSDEYDVSIVCPEQESSDMPPDDFELSLETVEGNLSTECYSDTPLRIGKTDSDCSSDAECDMVVIASNKSTDKIYSQTEIEVTLKANLMTNPKLNPASLPICSSTAGPEPKER